MSFDFSTLITDRTQADVSRVEQIAAKIKAGTASESELAEFHSAAMKGSYNYTDLNRVTAAMDDLKARLNGYGYDVPGYAPVYVDGNRTEWTEEDYPNIAQMTGYLSNVAAIRAALEVLAATPTMPGSMELLTWARANDIEQILLDADALLLAMSAAFLRSGMGWAYTGGPGFYFMN